MIGCTIYAYTTLQILFQDSSHLQREEKAGIAQSRTIIGIDMYTEQNLNFQLGLAAKYSPLNVANTI